MAEFLKIAGVALLAALLASVLDKRDHALAVSIGLLACMMALLACIRSFQPAARLFEELSELSGLGGGYLEPLVKTAGIGIVTQITCAVCADCGQNALAKIAELCGTVAALCMTLPLLRSVLDLLQEMVGG